MKGRAGISRVLGLTTGSIVKRVWVPLVIVLVLGCGAYVVAGLRNAFGSEVRPSYADAPGVQAARATPKELVYEVSGPEGAVAKISYFDVDAKPQEVEDAALPWSLTITSNSTSVIGSVVARGSSSRIGCRILVNGEVKAEKVTTGVDAFTYCTVMGA